VAAVSRRKLIGLLSESLERTAELQRGLVDLRRSTKEQLKKMDRELRSIRRQVDRADRLIEDKLQDDPRYETVLESVDEVSFDLEGEIDQTDIALEDASETIKMALRSLKNDLEHWR
jgi:hypothetical protein